MLISPEVFKVIWPSHSFKSQTGDDKCATNEASAFYLSLSPPAGSPRLLEAPAMPSHASESTLSPTKSQQRRVQKKHLHVSPYMLWKIVRKLKSNTQSHCSANAPFFKSRANLKKESPKFNPVSVCRHYDNLPTKGPFFFFFFFLDCLFAPSKR